MSTTKTKGRLRRPFVLTIRCGYYLIQVKRAAWARPPKRRIAWCAPTLAPLSADIVTVIVAVPPAEMENGPPLTEYATPEPVVPVIDGAGTASVPEVRFMTVTLIDFVWPEPDGTAPKLTLTGSKASDACTAEPRFSRPEPTSFTSVSQHAPLLVFNTFSSAVFTTAERTAQDGQFGCWPSKTAAEPARCGVAIEVPWKNAQHGTGNAGTHVSVPEPGIELSTFTPGAVTSGLTRKSTSVGPRLENPARTLLVARSWT